MHHPPAPVFHDRDVGVLAVEKAGPEQEADRTRRKDDQIDERAARLRLEGKGA